MADQPAKHAHQHVRRGPDPLPLHYIVYHIKVTPDEFSATAPIETGDDQFVFSIPQDMDEWYLTDVEISVTTESSSGIVQVQIRNVSQTHDFLSTRAQVDAGDFHSNDSGTQPVVNLSNDQVAHEDRIGIDIDAAGTGAYGLEVVLTFERETAP
jgi:hypothetical protein